MNPNPKGLSDKILNNTTFDTYAAIIKDKKKFQETDMSVLISYGAPSSYKNQEDL